MQMQNIAYTVKYQEYRKKFDYIFEDKYKCDIETKLLPDGKHTLMISYYSDTSHEVHKYNLNTSKTEVIDFNGNKIAEYKNIDHHIDFYSVVEHSNGSSYLFFSIDLYGYSIMNLSNYEVFHYIPQESFDGQGETFIWTNLLYCNKNNILAVDGCFWACQSSVEFYDFTNPEKLPLELIYSSYGMSDETNIDTDISPIRWDDDGMLVVSCYIDDDGNNVPEKKIDILSRSDMGKSNRN